MFRGALLLIFLFISTCTSVPIVPSETYTHKLIVDEDQPDTYQLFWKTNNDEITFEAHCKTNGWLGVGISPNGGMPGNYLKLYFKLFAFIFVL